MIYSDCRNYTAVADAHDALACSSVNFSTFLGRLR
jgi:hypothetical protein